VDSIKFSGDLIGAVSLNSLRVMELSLDRSTLADKISTSSDAHNGGEMTERQLISMDYPPLVEFTVPPRSMYILTGER
jgi:hypothetical protein